MGIILGILRRLLFLFNKLNNYYFNDNYSPTSPTEMLVYKANKNIIKFYLN